MNTKNATSYILSQLQSGISTEEITNQLRTAGWDEQTIQVAFTEAQSQIHPATVVDTPTQQVLPEPIKRGRMKTGWLLFKQSFSIIRHNPGLARYVVMSTLWAIVLIGLFTAAIFIDKDTSQTLAYPAIDQDGKDTIGFTPIGLAIGVLVGYLLHATTYYYGVALSSHVLGIFRGKSESYGYHIGIARKKLPAILTFAFISLVVGYIIQLIERNRILGWIAARLIGAAWALATTFVLPVIADRDDNGGKAVKESLGLFKKTWGETITGRVSVGGLATLIYLLIVIPVTILLTILFIGVLQSFIGILIVIVLFILTLVTWAILCSLMTSILNASLYYYAQYGTVPPSFSPELLASVFVTDKKKKDAK